MDLQSIPFSRSGIYPSIDRTFYRPKNRKSSLFYIFVPKPRFLIRKWDTASNFRLRRPAAFAGLAGHVVNTDTKYPKKTFLSLHTHTPIWYNRSDFEWEKTSVAGGWMERTRQFRWRINPLNRRWNWRRWAYYR